mmetsp:Transcript_40436/g.86239  ORF Transcript_40436/g.86239 Transcript_40436/m.86239 type:complete len:219 (-) Transcript_40436:534-1190(-)
MTRCSGSAAALGPMAQSCPTRATPTTSSARRSKRAVSGSGSSLRKASCTRATAWTRSTSATDPSTTRATCPAVTRPAGSALPLQTLRWPVSSATHSATREAYPSTISSRAPRRPTARCSSTTKRTGGFSIPPSNRPPASAWPTYAWTTTHRPRRHHHQSRPRRHHHHRTHRPRRHQVQCRESNALRAATNPMTGATSGSTGDCSSCPPATAHQRASKS